MRELKCCPFCGGEAYTDKIGKPLFTIRCTNINCYCEISKNSLEDAINAWNTRTPMDNIVEKLEELKKDNTNGCEKVNQELCNSYLDCGLCLIDRIINIVKQEINNGLE